MLLFEYYLYYLHLPFTVLVQQYLVHIYIYHDDSDGSLEGYRRRESRSRGLYINDVSRCMCYNILYVKKTVGAIAQYKSNDPKGNYSTNLLKSKPGRRGISLSFILVLSMPSHVKSPTYSIYQAP
jgi:hypothetical protein